MSGGVADRVVLSFRAPGVPADDPDAEWELAGNEWVTDGLADEHFVGYLRRAHAGPVAVGDEFEEFVSRGCTSPYDVVLRVEAVEGGDDIGEGTAFAFVARRDALRGAQP
ncbi:MAG: hypothetical protein ABEH77_06380 [Halobacteriaceae archaeon]